MRKELIVALLLGAATVLAGCSSKSSGYPDAYLLAADELPSGLKLSEVPPEMAAYGFTNNPAEIPPGTLQMVMANAGEGLEGFLPNKLWVELIEKTTSSSEHGADGGLMIAAAFWNDPQKASDAINRMRSESDGQLCGAEAFGRILHDSNVVVIIGGDGSMSSFLEAIESKLRSKSPGLTNVC